MYLRHGPPVLYSPTAQAGGLFPMPNIPHVQPSYPVLVPGAPQFGCTGCKRGVGAISFSTMSTGAKIAIGLLGLGAAFGGYKLYRHLR